MTPDLWLLVGLFAVGVLLYVAYFTGSLAAERRQALRNVPKWKICPACNGRRRGPKGQPCLPCEGTGIKWSSWLVQPRD